MSLAALDDSAAGIAEAMTEMGEAARAAAQELANAPTAAKNTALQAMARNILASGEEILAANARDLETARAADHPAAFIDRLTLNDDRIAAMATGLTEIAALPDPVGDVSAAWERPNGLKFERVRVPIGVIGIIYESRPNVTADAGALCMKSGNAAILRGGSDSFETSAAILACLRAGLKEAGIHPAAIQMVPTTDRAAVGMMLSGLDGVIDVIVPRGAARAWWRGCRTRPAFPVFAHLEGLCHVYVDASADLEMAKAIAVNAKMRRTGVCGAAETLLIDEARAGDFVGPLTDALTDAGCALRGDTASHALDNRIEPATEEDWTTEYLDSVISVKVVSGVDGAIEHIARYGSNHTDSIVADDAGVADRFLRRVDSAIVLHNASTQFADGGEFGMGAEIGIATGKLHARGPVALEQLTTFKYVVRGSGQTRP